MSRQAPPIHGRDHLPGAADPIEFEQTWPTQHTFDPYVDVESSFEESLYVRVDDFAATIHGGYIQSTANGAWILWPVRLGPIGSVWGVFITVHNDTDHGIIEYQWANADDNAYGPGRYTVNVDATWVTHPVGRDLYAAAPSKNNVFGFESAFRIEGVDGAPLTSISGTDPDIAVSQFNGGAGLYLFRIHVNGKNGSSSSYKTRIATVTVRRQPG